MPFVPSLLRFGVEALWLLQDFEDLPGSCFRCCPSPGSFWGQRYETPKDKPLPLRGILEYLVLLLYQEYGSSDHDIGNHWGPFSKGSA